MSLLAANYKSMQLDLKKTGQSVPTGTPPGVDHVAVTVVVVPLVEAVAFSKSVVAVAVDTAAVAAAVAVVASVAAVPTVMNKLLLNPI